MSAESKALTLFPITDIAVPESAVSEIQTRVLRASKSAQPQLVERLHADLERFSNHTSSPLNVLLLPFMTEYFCSLYDYFPDNAAVVFDDIKLVQDKIRVHLNAHAQRVKSMSAAGLLLPDHIRSVLTAEALTVNNKFALGFSPSLCTVNLFTVKAIHNIKAQSLPPFYNDLSQFFELLKTVITLDGKAVIYVRDEGALKAVTKTLAEADIGVDETIRLVIGNVLYGFFYPSERLLCVGINDLQRKTELKKSDKRKRLAFELPETGDYVVHEKHGVGISNGLQRVKTSWGEADFYVVSYAGGDKLYLPVENLDALDKYNGADEPSLHRLGGAEFERVKQRVKASVKEMAFSLLELYKARHAKKGFVYSPDTEWQRDFENDFEYEETEDQLIAISEIKNDMESGKIMDRLLCGDVGYGKTEVAMRAVFKTVIEHKQAAVLVPTTILAQQHYESFKKRFEKYGVRVELLSRFVSRIETAEALKRIESGTSHVVIATHKLLYGDIKFFDLGLLVLDEEQRFGVEHKEKLKVFRNKVNILSMSATPIPRTLHMSLSGIRDISTLETPPLNRLPIETYITTYSDALLSDALNKELSRGGQAFILYNRVADIESFYKKVRLLVPKATVIYAHGQMPEDILEEQIELFYQKKAQILVSTTIIENGIDLPDANTLFVVDADALGLSQLYQLRGRVGRSEVQAYAYFTVNEGKTLTEKAQKRLSALQDNTELGSGFKIAMRDLEIRGAGNLLGREQHGQMEKVGYEMYLKLIKEGIDELQGITVGTLRDVELAVEGAGALDDKYIPDAKGRVVFYKRASVISSKEEGQEYFSSLQKLYGEPPESVKNIIRIAIIKNIAKKIGIKRVLIVASATKITFYDAACLSDQRLYSAVSAFAKYCVLQPSESPNVTFHLGKVPQSMKIRLVLEFLTKAVEN